MNAEIEIPKERTYKIPAGHYQSKIDNVTVRRAKINDDLNCCITFIANVPGKERYECCARAVFPFDLAPKSQLRTFLEGLLGRQYFTENAGLSINLEKILRDMDCVIEVVHGPHNEDKYDWPMVLVTSAKPVPLQPVNKDKETSE